MPGNRILLLSLLAVAALVFGACGSNGEAVPVGAGSDRAVAIESPAGDGSAGPADQIGACMRNAGFEYTVAPATTDAEPVPASSARELARSFAEREGYGVTSFILGSLGRGLDGEIDPQTAYIQTLSQAETEQYYLALNGPGGCLEQASDDAVGPDADDFTDEDRSEIAELLTAVQGSPDVAAATQDWSRCMAEQGYTVQSFADLELAALQLVVETVPILRGSVTVSESGALSADNLPGLSEEDADLALEVERAMALADQACRDEAWIPVVVSTIYDLGEEQAVPAELLETFVRTEVGEAYVRD